MGILDTSIETVALNEKEMRAEFLEHWIENHTPKNSENFRIETATRWRKKGQYNFRVISVITSPKETIKCLALDAPASIDNASNAVTTINMSNKINIKPDPNHRYIISNIIDSDLSSFELRTKDKAGAALYCINCTPKIAEKSKKWRYVFFKETPDGLRKIDPVNPDPIGNLYSK